MPTETAIRLMKPDEKTIVYGENGLEVNFSNVKNFIDAIYPVGSLYLSIGNDPNTLFADTTWEQLVGGALFATNIGGGKLIEGKLPPLPTITCDSAGAHTHTVSGSRSTGYYVPSGSYYGKDETATQTTSSSGAHTHTVSYGTSEVYGQTSGDVIPTSIGIKVYKRTA